MPLRGLLLTIFGGGALLELSEVNRIAPDLGWPIEAREEAW